MALNRDEQVRALYRAALERPAEERAGFVAAQSGGDTALRNSVEALLSRRDATDMGSNAAESDAGELPLGTQIGSYRIDAVLGRGGMGVVYRAMDAKLNRPVAIKFLSAAVADAQMRARFRQEGRRDYAAPVRQRTKQVRGTRFARRLCFRPRRAQRGGRRPL